jgi:hypothetical protein
MIQLWNALQGTSIRRSHTHDVTQSMCPHVSHVHELLGILWRQGFGWHKFWLVTTTIVVNGFIIVVKGFIVVNGFVIVFETLAQEL